MAIGDEEGVCRYCGDDYINVLTKIASQDDTQYSWRCALIAEIDGVKVGGIVGYDGAKLRTLRDGTFRVLNATIGRVPNIVDETEAGEYYLDSVAVLPNYRGRGVSRALVKTFCDMAYAEGHERVGLIVDKENSLAEGLYTSVGFRRVGSRPFFTHQMWHLQRESINHSYTINNINERSSKLVEQLTALWEASVRATHHFLSEDDICEIRGYVPMALTGVGELIVAMDELQNPVAFMGVEDGRLEMLFVEPQYIGKGVGRLLVRNGIDCYGINEVTVNEQNPSAVGFYKHMGFRESKRSDFDEQGRPFPLIYMTLERE